MSRKREPPLPPLTRPNGKVYRPRKYRCTQGGGADWFTPFWVLVLGTHDVELAREIAERRAAEHDVHALKTGVTGWWRESIRNHEPYWEHDVVRGAAGVMFEEVM